MPNLPSDSDVVLIIYSSGNKGQHKVVGAATKRVYGHYKGGDRFYVHARDIAAQPGLFQPVQKEIIAPQESQPQEIPEPAPIQETAPASQQPAPTSTPIPSSTHPIEAIEESESSAPEPSDSEVPVGFDVLPISLEELPGISPQILQYLNAGGIHDVEQLKGASVEELVKIKGIGESRAEAILEFINQYFEAQSE